MQAMSTTRLLHLSLGLVCGLAILPAQAQRYTITQNTGTDTFGAKSTGQTFTPSVGILPNPGSIKSLPLEKVTLYHGNYKPAAASATTWLNIYDDDPNKGGKFVGSSLNAVDTRSLSFHDPMVWSFAKLSLNTSLKHWAVMSSTNTAGGLDIAVSLETNPRSSSAYSGGAGLIANIVEHSNGVDARFEIDFFTGIQGMFSVSGAGCAASSGTPAIAAPCLPQVGRPFDLVFDDLVPGSLLYVILGASSSNWSGIQLPVSVAKIIPGTSSSCTLYASLDILLPTPVSGGRVVLPTMVPNVTGLFGTTLYVQGAQGETSGRLSMSPLGRVFVGQ